MEDSISRLLEQAANGPFHLKQKAVMEAEASAPWEKSPRLRVLRNCTVENLETFVRFESFRLGTRLEVSFSDFNAYETEILDKKSPLYSQEFDLILLTLCLEE